MFIKHCLIPQILFKMKPETLSDKPKWDDIEAKVEVGQGGVPLPNSTFGLQLKTCVKMDKPENMKLGGSVFFKCFTFSSANYSNS